MQKQIAADDPFAGKAVRPVGGTLEPVADGVEYRQLVDADRADGFAGETREPVVLVEDLSVGGRIEYGTCEKDFVEHARDGPAVGFGTDAVVEPVVALLAGGIFEMHAVARELLRTLHAGARRVCENTRMEGQRKQDGYANPKIHLVKDNVFFSACRIWEVQKWCRSRLRAGFSDFQLQTPPSSARRLRPPKRIIFANFSPST